MLVSNSSRVTPATKMFAIGSKKQAIQKQFLEISMKREPSAPWMQKNSPEVDSSKITQAIARQVQNEFNIKASLNRLERNHHFTNDSLGFHEP